jgi:N-acetylglutamate synthase/N-acetylornithine aminotransferase
VVSAGDVVEPAPAELVSGPEIEFVLTMPGEGGEAEVFFSDLSPEYVNYNADYTS